jgi:hypothetical protein
VSAQVDITLANSSFRHRIVVQIFSGGVAKHVEHIVLDVRKRAIFLNNELRSHTIRQASKDVDLR